MNKKGGIFIEASLVMPMTLLIVICSISLAMTFHGKLMKQIDEHSEYLADSSHALQLEIIRNYERIFK